MLAFTCYLPNAYNNAKIKKISILAMLFFYTLFQSTSSNHSTNSSTLLKSSAKVQ